MKKVLFSITFTLLAIIFLNRKTEFKSEDSIQIEEVKLPKTTFREKPKETPSKKQLPSTTKSKISTFKNLPLVSEKKEHDATTDAQGNIYPVSLNIDEEHIIAYSDIIVGEAKYLDDYQSGDKEIKISPPVLWNKAIIPYLFGDIEQYQKDAFTGIINEIKNKTGVHFTPYDKSKHDSWIKLKKGGQHCYAQLGMQRGESIVSLNEKCGRDEIFHELFHVLGFLHEQNRFDRDDHIQIIWENINEEHWPQFERFSSESYHPSLRNEPFSFKSFMLYPPQTFSNTPSDYSIVTLDGEAYSSLTNPSEVDFQRIRNLYREEL